MPDQLPFAVPARIPNKITPCPIIEAVMELRFVPGRPWVHFPGIFAEHFAERFPKELDLGIGAIPEAIRQQDPLLSHAPYRRMVGKSFLLQFGPRSVSLVTKQNDYPGWDAFIAETRLVMAQIEQLKIIKETTRMGLRYINFFAHEIFAHLTLSLSFQGNPKILPETGVNTVLHEGDFRHFVQINNSAVINDSNRVPRLGSILDVDTTFKAPPHDLQQGVARFVAAHASEKRVFFGLLKPEFVATLNPEYTDETKAGS